MYRLFCRTIKTKSFQYLTDLYVKYHIYVQMVLYCIGYYPSAIVKI